MDQNILSKLAASVHQEYSGLWTRKNMGLLHFHSHHFYRRFGLNSYEIEEEVWLELIHPDDRQSLKNCIVDHVTKRYELGKICYRVKELSGHYVMLESTGIRYEEDGKDAFMGHHRIISERQVENHIDSLTGLKSVNALTSDLKNFNSPEHYYYLVSSDKVEHRSKLLGTTITQELADIVEHAALCSSLNRTEVYSLSQSHFIIKAVDTQSVAKSEELIDCIVQSSYRSDYISRDELTLVLVPEKFMLESNDIENFAINASHHASEFSSGKFLLLDRDINNEILRRTYIQQALKIAIKNQEIQIAVQPIVNSGSLSLYSNEVLARWHHSILGNIKPDEFIPLIEKLGYTAEFGWLIFDKSCQYLAQHQNERVNINISIKFLKSHQFIEKSVHLVDMYRLRTNQIYLEITESLPIDDEPDLIITLKELKIMGFNLSLDDFGTGYTSLLAAFNLPLSQIKIDKKLISNLQDNKTFVYLIEFLRKLTEERNISLVAEGIETMEQIHVTRQLGIDLLQGYKIARPQIVDI